MVAEKWKIHLPEARLAIFVDRLDLNTQNLVEVIEFLRPVTAKALQVLPLFYMYCEIIYFHGAQFSWIHENGYIRGDENSWVGWLV